MLTFGASSRGKKETSPLLGSQQSSARGSSPTIKRKELLTPRSLATPAGITTAACYDFLAEAVETHITPREMKPEQERWYDEDLSVRLDDAGCQSGTTLVVDTSRYSAKSLSSWINVLLRLQGTVWKSPRLWKSCGLIALTSLITSICVLGLVSDPASLKAAKFQKMTSFLNVFVGMLLGFFLSSSISRWYGCADGFLDFFDAIRNLQMQFCALGVSCESEAMCVRYGLLSAWLLRMELYTAMRQDEQERKEYFLIHWKQLKMERPGLVKAKEEEFLLKMARGGETDTSLLVWTWVASKVGAMAQAGEIPPMASPTYGRVMNLLQNAHAGMRQVRGTMLVQVPFIYTHMLACLVHINNFINGLSFGLVLGTTVGTVMQWMRMRNIEVEAPIPAGAGVNGGLNATGVPLQGSVEGYDHAARSSEVTGDIQNMIISFFFSVFGPIIYHALLEVAINIAQPFDNEEGAIPTASMIMQLETDILQAKLFSEHLTDWKKPQYEVIKK